MVQQIFINLPVENLQRSMDFFTALGFQFNSTFTDEKAACLVLGENLYAMLLHKDFFATFTKKPVADAQQSTEVLLGISIPSRTQVDAMIATAVEHGGQVYLEAQDHGWMYQRSFADPDGHQWELIYIDASQAPG
jgi:hypothetical protein